jgi:hypothetical protein
MKYEPTLFCQFMSLMKSVGWLVHVYHVGLISFLLVSWWFQCVTDSICHRAKLSLNTEKWHQIFFYATICCPFTLTPLLWIWQITYKNWRRTTCIWQSYSRYTFQKKKKNCIKIKFMMQNFCLCTSMSIFLLFYISKHLYVNYM